MSGLTKPYFAMQCAFMIEHIARWQSSSLTTGGDMKVADVHRFTQSIRERLDMLDEDSTRAALTDQSASRTGEG